MLRSPPPSRRLTSPLHATPRVGCNIRVALYLLVVLGLTMALYPAAVLRNEYSLRLTRRSPEDGPLLNIDHVHNAGDPKERFHLRPEPVSELQQMLAASSWDPELQRSLSSHTRPETVHEIEAHEAETAARQYRLRERKDGAVVFPFPWSERGPGSTPQSPLPPFPSVDSSHRRPRDATLRPCVMADPGRIAAERCSPEDVPSAQVLRMLRAAAARGDNATVAAGLAAPNLGLSKADRAELATMVEAGGFHPDVTDEELLSPELRRDPFLKAGVHFPCLPTLHLRNTDAADSDDRIDFDRGLPTQGLRSDVPAGGRLPPMTLAFRAKVTAVPFQPSPALGGAAAGGGTAAPAPPHFRCPSGQCMLVDNDRWCVQSPYYFTAPQEAPPRLPQTFGPGTPADEHRGRHSDADVEAQLSFPTDRGGGGPQGPQGPDGPTLVCPGDPRHALPAVRSLARYLGSAKTQAVLNDTVRAAHVLQDGGAAVGGDTTAAQRMAAAQQELSVRLFKRATAWMFPVWTDWSPGVCAAPRRSTHYAATMTRQPTPAPPAPPTARRVLANTDDVQEDRRAAFRRQLREAREAHTSTHARPRTTAPLPPTRRSATTRAPAAEYGRMHGYHSVIDGFYRLENVCVSSHGRLSGYRPQLETYRGTDEIASGIYDQFQENDVNGWIRATAPLSEPPPCFFDKDVIVVVGNRRSHNHGHALRRYMAAMAAAQDDAFRGTGSSSPNYLTLFLETDRPGETKGHGYFYRLLSKQWASLFAAPLYNLTSERLGAWGLERPPPERTLCFRSIVVGQVCRAVPNGPSPCDITWSPGAHHALRMFGKRRSSDIATLGLFRRAVRACGHIPERALNTVNPMVVYAHRRLARRDFDAVRIHDTLFGTARAVARDESWAQLRAVAIARLRPRIDAAGFLRDGDVLFDQAYLHNYSRRERYQRRVGLGEAKHIESSTTKTAGGGADFRARRHAGPSDPPPAVPTIVPEFRVVEYALDRNDPIQVLRLFAAADVVTGAYGSGLTWQFNAPPGAVTAMISRHHWLFQTIGWGDTTPTVPQHVQLLPSNLAKAAEARRRDIQRERAAGSTKPEREFLLEQYFRPVTPRRPMEATRRAGASLNGGTDYGGDAMAANVSLLVLDPIGTPGGGEGGDSWVLPMNVSRRMWQDVFCALGVHKAEVPFKCPHGMKPNRFETRGSAM